MSDDRPVQRIRPDDIPADLEMDSALRVDKVALREYSDQLARLASFLRTLTGRMELPPIVTNEVAAWLTAIEGVQALLTALLAGDAQ